MGFQAPGAGFGALGMGFGALDAGFWALGMGFRALGAGSCPAGTQNRFCLISAPGVGSAWAELQPAFGSRSQPHTQPIPSHSSFGSQRSQGGKPRQGAHGSSWLVGGWGTSWGPPGGAGRAWRETEAFKAAVRDGHAGLGPCTGRWGISVHFLAAVLPLRAEGGRLPPHGGHPGRFGGREGPNLRSVLTAQRRDAAPQLGSFWRPGTKASPGTAAGSACTAAKLPCSAAIGSQRQPCCSQSPPQRSAVSAATNAGSSAGWRPLCSSVLAAPLGRSSAPPGGGTESPLLQEKSLDNERGARRRPQKFISPTVRVMKPQKQSLNIYKVIQRPTEISGTKEGETEGRPPAKSSG